MSGITLRECLEKWNEAICAQKAGGLTKNGDGHGGRRIYGGNPGDEETELEKFLRI